MHCIEISKYIDAFILNPLGEHNRHCVLGNLGDCNFFQNDVTYLSDVTEKDAFFLFFDTREKRKAQGQRRLVHLSEKHHVFGYKSDMSILLCFLMGTGMQYI